MYKYSNKIWKKLETYLKEDNIDYLIDHVDEGFVYVVYKRIEKYDIAENGPEKQVPVQLSPFIHLVADRDEVKVMYLGTTASSCKEGYAVCFESEADMDELIEDALCEEKRYKTFSCIPVYSRRTLDNQEKLKRLKELNNKKGFHVYDPSNVNL